MGRLVVGDICMGSCPRHEEEEGGRNKMKAVAQQQKAVKF